MRKPLPPSMLLARSTSTSRRQEIKYVQSEEARYRWKHLYHGVVAPCVLSASRDRASIFVTSIVSSFHQLASLEFQYSGPASLRFKAEELLTEDLPIRLANYLDKNPKKPTGDINSHSKLSQYLKDIEKKINLLFFHLETMRNFLISGI